MYKILVADSLAPAAIGVFRRRGLCADVKTGMNPDALKEIIGDYHGLVVRSATRPDAKIIAAAKKLQVIGRAGVGVDNIDMAAATVKGIVVMNAPQGNAVTTAEHTLAMIFAAARGIPAASALTQKGKWPKKDFIGIELTGKTLGLIGCGNIGSIVAERALGLKMKVVAHDPFLTTERAIALGVEKCTLDALLDRADVISLHTPLTDQTRYILSEKTLAAARPGVIVVNCARGGLVDEAALRACLNTGHVAAAACDVFEKEPAHDSVLFGAATFVATPHLGASTVEAQDKVAVQIAEQMSDFLLTGAVSSALNTPSMSAEEAPRLKPYIELAGKLGLFAGQIADEGLAEVHVEYEGDIALLNTESLTAAALAGLLRPALRDVNMVSAPAVLKARGGHLTVSTTDSSPVYDGLIRLRIAPSGGGERSLAGAIVNGLPRIVEVKSVSLDAKFRPHILFVNNADQPGFIGFLGALLGAAGINIATFNLGRTEPGGEAIALVGVDQHIGEDILVALRASPHVRYAKSLSF